TASRRPAWSGASGPSSGSDPDSPRPPARATPVAQSTPGDPRRLAARLAAQGPAEGRRAAPSGASFPGAADGTGPDGRFASAEPNARTPRPAAASPAPTHRGEVKP